MAAATTVGFGELDPPNHKASPTLTAPAPAIKRPVEIQASLVMVERRLATLPGVTLLVGFLVAFWRAELLEPARAPATALPTNPNAPAPPRM